MTREESDVRVEGSVTTISWVPAEAVERDARAGFRLGTSRADDEPPADLGPDIDATLDALGDRLPLRQPPVGVRRVRRRRRGAAVRRAGQRAARPPDGAARGRAGDRDHPDAGATGRARGRAGLGALRSDVGRPDGVEHGQGDAAAAVRALPRAGGVDDARAHAARRRAGRWAAGRRVAVPPPLGVRHRRSPRRHERHHGLEGLGRIGDRRPHAMGRGGLPGLRDRGPVGVGAGAGRDAPARHAAAPGPPAVVPARC